MLIKRISFLLTFRDGRLDNRFSVVRHLDLVLELGDGHGVDGGYWWVCDG
jgi:hypothetical protein